jgi:hypothetical protein
VVPASRAKHRHINPEAEYYLKDSFFQRDLYYRQVIQIKGKNLDLNFTGDRVLSSVACTVSLRSNLDLIGALRCKFVDDFK